VRKSCAVCSKEFEAAKPNARFCGATCRKRSSRSKPATPQPSATTTAAAVTAPASSAGAPPSVGSPQSLYEAVKAKLAEVERLDTIAGAHALELANRIVNAPGMNTGVAALSKQLQAVLAEALVDTSTAADPMDELEKRRAEKLARAAAS
jgi:hypothetical protein